MNTFSIYKKTFKFTLMRLLSGIVGTILIVGLPVLAFFLTGNMSDEARIGVIVGALIVACIVVGLLSHFIGYTFKAGQIAMAAKAIAEDKLPDDPYKEGKEIIKKRFGTVAIFFAIEKIINGIVHQLTSGISKLTNSIGDGKNDTANIIGVIIEVIISAMLQFMCACCMGWVFIHEGQNPWRCAADGAIIYFKNWKDLLKNTGKVLLFGLISLIVLGGLLFGLTHAVMDNMAFMPEVTNGLIDLCKEAEINVALTASQWALVIEGITAFILWAFVHSAFIDPFIMISVMKRYLKAGLANPPARELDEKLCGLSKSYRKALDSAQA